MNFYVINVQFSGNLKALTGCFNSKKITNNVKVTLISIDVHSTIIALYLIMITSHLYYYAHIIITNECMRLFIKLSLNFEVNL